MDELANLLVEIRDELKAIRQLLEHPPMEITIDPAAIQIDPETLLRG